MRSDCSVGLKGRMSERWVGTSTRSRVRARKGRRPRKYGRTCPSEAAREECREVGGDVKTAPEPVIVLAIRERYGGVSKGERSVEARGSEARRTPFDGEGMVEGEGDGVRVVMKRGKQAGVTG